MKKTFISLSTTVCFHCCFVKESFSYLGFRRDEDIHAKAVYTTMPSHVLSLIDFWHKGKHCKTLKLFVTHNMDTMHALP
ncbi:MAG: hypothetical protein MJA29_01080, partial [Candidatus Omnitrophica bacterium]|nr:hypothetical protein [Candidatus Omnitrophota bacterium]